MKGLPNDSNDNDANATKHAGTRNNAGRYAWPIAISLLIFGWLWYRRPIPASSSLPPSIFHHLGQYSPYFPVELYILPPDGCIPDQVSILMRHGSRYPTTGAAKIIHATIDKLKNASLKEGNIAKEMEFLKEYRYTLGEEDLVPLGVKEAQNAAQEAYRRYGRLATDKGVFMRTSSSGRVQQTAQEWRKGFLEASSNSVHIPPPLVIADAAGSNDTLANNGCPNHRYQHNHWTWASHFTLPIISRLESHFSSPISLDNKDIITLFGLCAFESVAKRSTSPFCLLFTKDEILDFEYYQDLEKLYNRGYGNHLGPVEGVGYVNELIARLTDSEVVDGTQTNRTLDGDHATFPLDKGVYADFSHDNTMAAIVSAIGLFHDSTLLPSTHRILSREWKFGHIAPFGGRLVFERMQCSGTPSIRILADDAVLDLPFCVREGKDGKICTVKDFVASQSFARVEGQELWKECGWRPAEQKGDQTESSVKHDSIG